MVKICEENIEEIINIIKTAGNVLAIKTDTVYGLVCNANDEIACKEIYEIKNREEKKPLILFVKNENELNKYLKEIPLCAKPLISNYWPGALTIIFNKKDELFNYLTKYKTIGIRIPNDEVLIKILNKIDFPLASTSCNISGEKPYENIYEIEKNLEGRLKYVVSGTAIKKGIPSTIVDVSKGYIKLIREGSIKIG